MESRILLMNLFSQLSSCFCPKEHFAAIYLKRRQNLTLQEQRIECPMIFIKVNFVVFSFLLASKKQLLSEIINCYHMVYEEF